MTHLADCRRGSSRGGSPEQSTLSGLPQPVAVTADLDDMGMVQQPVEHGAGQGGVSVERPLPISEREVGREDDRAVLVGMMVGTPAELPAVVREHDVDAPESGLECGQHVVVHQVNGGDRHLVRIQPRPSVARVAVDGGLQVHPAHALQGADKEGVHGHQRAGMRRFDVALAELGTETLQKPDLLLGELELALRGGLLKAQQPVVLGQQSMALPHSSHASGPTLDSLRVECVPFPSTAYPSAARNE